jgi:hypothetical protein
MKIFPQTPVDCVSYLCHSAKKRSRNFAILEQQEKANIKRANKTQHKSKLVKMKFSEFFSSFCCWLLHRLLLLACLLAAAETARIFALIFLLLAHFHMLIIQLSFYLLLT